MKTVQLVDRIKCETRAALQDKIITLLQEERKTNSDPLIDRFIKERGKVWQLKRTEFKPGYERAFYDKYIGMAIAYNFTFDISEDNKAVAQFDLLKPFSGGVLGFGLTETGDLNRQNSRNFVVSEDFGSLLTKEITGCEGAVFTPNYVYPISGAIGLKELIDTFVDLNRADNLKIPDQQRVFADTLKFTTTLTSAGGPSAKFVMAGRGLQFMDASMAGTASRTDVHTVIIGLSTPPAPAKSTAPAKTAAASASPSRLLSSPSPFVPLRALAPVPLSAPATLSAQDAAINATTAQRFNTFLDRFGDGTIRP